MRSPMTSTRAAGVCRRHLSYYGLRLLWALMLLIHMGAIPAVWSTLLAPEEQATRFAPVFRLVGLVLATIFCGLKTIDVGWLRLKPGWRSGVSTTLVIALLHVSIIERIEQDNIAFSPAHLGVFLIAGAIVESQTVRRALRHLAHKLATSNPLRTMRDQLASLAPACQRRFDPHLDPHWRGPCTSRAPPSC